MVIEYEDFLKHELIDGYNFRKYGRKEPANESKGTVKHYVRCSVKGCPVKYHYVATPDGRTFCEWTDDPIPCHNHDKPFPGERRRGGNAVRAKIPVSQPSTAVVQAGADASSMHAVTAACSRKDSTGAGLAVLSAPRPAARSQRKAAAACQKLWLDSFSHEQDDEESEVVHPTKRARGPHGSVASPLSTLQPAVDADLANQSMFQHDPLTTAPVARPSTARGIKRTLDGRAATTPPPPAPASPGSDARLQHSGGAVPIGSPQAHPDAQLDAAMPASPQPAASVGQAASASSMGGPSAGAPEQSASDGARRSARKPKMSAKLKFSALAGSGPPPAPAAHAGTGTSTPAVLAARKRGAFQGGADPYASAATYAVVSVEGVESRGTSPATPPQASSLNAPPARLATEADMHGAAPMAGVEDAVMMMLGDSDAGPTAAAEAALPDARCGRCPLFFLACVATKESWMA